MVDPLRKLLRKGQNWEWDDQQNCAFKLLKESLEDTKTITYWKQFKKNRVTIDAQSFALGARLEQKLEHSEVFKIVSYASWSLTEVEIRYFQTEHEAVAAVWGCDFRIFLLGINFELFSNYKELLQIYSRTSKPSARIERWFLLLQQFYFEIKYKKGTENLADALEAFYTKRH